MKQQSVSKRPNPRARRVKQEPIRWPKKPKRRILPAWVPVGVALGLCAMLVLTINFRAYSELTKESREFNELNTKIQHATSENLSLQEEIYYLKNDPNTVEREAKKFGFAAPKAEPKQIQEPLESEVQKADPQPTKKEKVSKAGEPDKAEKSANRPPPTRK